MRHIRVLIMEPHALVATIVRETVERDSALAVVGEIAGSSDALEAVARLSPDVALINVTLRDGSGINLVRELTRARPQLPIVLIGEEGDDDYFAEAHRIGAASYLTRHQIPQELTALIRRVAPLSLPSLSVERARELGILIDLSALLSPVNLQESMRSSLALLRRATDAEAGEIFVWEPEIERLVLGAFDGIARPAFAQMTSFRLGEGYPGTVLQRLEPIVTTDLREDDRYMRSEVRHKDFRAFVCYPLIAPSGPAGVLDLASRQRDFDVRSAVRLLSHAGGLIASTLAAGRQLRRLRDESLASHPGSTAGRGASQ